VVSPLAPHMKLTAIAKAFGVAASTGQSKEWRPGIRNPERETIIARRAEMEKYKRGISDGETWECPA
jgi:hypothetical protein